MPVLSALRGQARDRSRVLLHERRHRIGESEQEPLRSRGGGEEVEEDEGRLVLAQELAEGEQRVRLARAQGSENQRLLPGRGLRRRGRGRRAPGEGAVQGHGTRGVFIRVRLATSMALS